jgi:RNA polymerase sigma-70 factor, ECF subfamily
LSNSLRLPVWDEVQPYAASVDREVVNLSIRPMEHDPAAEAESRKRLVALLTRHQRQIFSYIYVLVHNRSDAEDLLQETSVVICEKFNDFREGTDFVAWACQIAYWRVRYSRQKYARSKVLFDQEIVDVVAKTAGEMTDELDERHEALAQCLQKLNSRDRELLLARYEPGGGVEDAARRSGRTVQTAYKALARLRKLLLDCVTTRIAHTGTA